MEYKEGNELIEYYVGSKTKVWLVKRPDFSLIKSKRYEFREFHTSYLILPTSQTYYLKCFLFTLSAPYSSATHNHSALPQTVYESSGRNCFAN
jgi:hypothetical protein